MIEIARPHNLFKQSKTLFEKADPQMAMLKEQKLTYRPALIDEIPLKTPGIYILTGGRQVGKSTLIKLIILDLLKKGTDAGQIFYLPCDTLEHFQQLLEILMDFARELDPGKPFYLFVDEVTYVKEWDRAIKAMADQGFFRRGSLLLTGSDTVLLKEAMMRFPGRRGAADRTDFHLHPLSFFEFTALHRPSLAAAIEDARTRFLKRPLSLKFDPPPQGEMKTLYELWDSYLLTGGYITAINSLASSGAIQRSVYQTYVAWIRGDLLKKGKREDYARDLLQALVERIGSQLTWNGLASHTLIEHHQTVAEYVSQLERMNVLFVLEALREDKLKPSPKKAKKIHFWDPFIFHAVRSFTSQSDDPFALARDLGRTSPHLMNSLIEGVISALARREHRSYYIKGDGEVDLALVQDGEFLPVEIKWSATPRQSDLKQILKYKKGIVACRTQNFGTMGSMTLVPIPWLALVVA